MATTRLSRGIISLAASAIGAVYTAGYLHTQAADASLGASAAPPVVPAATSAPAVAQPPTIGIQNTPPPATTPPNQRATAPAAAAPVGAALKDGTFSGVGTSRRGDVQVSVTIQGGRIASVNITRATTQYPTRFIAGLPNEVVSRQSAQVDVVSGATLSSQAFRGAVQQALQRAQA